MCNFAGLLCKNSLLHRGGLCACEGKQLVCACAWCVLMLVVFPW
jgi:hypothetical protein